MIYETQISVQRKLDSSIDSLPSPQLVPALYDHASLGPSFFLPRRAKQRRERYRI